MWHGWALCPDQIAFVGTDQNRCVYSGLAEPVNFCSSESDCYTKGKIACYNSDSCRGGPVTGVGHSVRDCRLQTGNDPGSCNGAHYNLDLYVRTSGGARNKHSNRSRLAGTRPYQKTPVRQLAPAHILQQPGQKSQAQRRVLEAHRRTNPSLRKVNASWVAQQVPALVSSSFLV